MAKHGERASKGWHARPSTQSLDTLDLRQSKRFIELSLRTWGPAVLDPYNGSSSVEAAISHWAT
jgi:predicted secreted hydrolase